MFTRKPKPEVKGYDTPRYKEGNVVFRPGEWPRSPLVIYKNLYTYHKNEPCIFAAEFLWDENETDPGIVFVRNVTVAETLVSTKELPSVLQSFLDLSYKSNVENHEFIKDSKVYYADQASTQTLFSVRVAMLDDDVHVWNDLRHDMALALYHDLHRAMLNGSPWEATKTVKPRQTLNGKYMVSINLD
jgi:hypothetical protein